MSKTPETKTVATSEAKANRFRRSSRLWRRAQRHVLLSAAYERGLQSDIEKLLTRIVRSAAKHVANGAPEQAEKVVSAYTTSFTRLFEGRLEAVALASAKVVFEELSAEKGGSAGFETKFISLFEIAQAAVRTWLSSYAAAKVVQILENTRQQIRKAIVRGNEQDEPPRVLARRIRDETGGVIAKRRAETIARTETGIAASIGANEAATATGLKLDKRWISTEDQRTRPTHHEANDQLRAMNQMFDVGGAKMRFPRDPNGPAKEVINCRCICLYEPHVPKSVGSDQLSNPAPANAAPFDAKPKSERALHEKYFSDAPDALKEIIRQTAETVAVKNRKGARSNWRGGVITMNSGKSDGEYGATWRHEFGHHIDLSRQTVSAGATKEVAQDSNQIVATAKKALSTRIDREAEISRHAEELAKLSAADQKRALTELLRHDMITAGTLEKYGRPLDSVAGLRLALRLHYNQKAEDWNSYLEDMYRAFVDGETKTLALMTADYIGAITKDLVGFGHGSKYYRKYIELNDGIRKGQVLEAFANHIAITGSRAELVSIFGKIVNRLAPQTWAKMQEIVDGLR